MNAQLKLADVLAAAEADEGEGFCLACGEAQFGCEPDAQGYECECCGAKRVFGAAEILVCGGVL